jgi:hypothetical protein
LSSNVNEQSTTILSNFLTIHYGEGVAAYGEGVAAAKSTAATIRGGRVS